jgi:hypothetical protein
MSIVAPGPDLPFRIERQRVISRRSDLHNRGALQRLDQAYSSVLLNIVLLEILTRMCLDPE